MRSRKNIDRKIMNNVERDIVLKLFDWNNVIVSRTRTLRRKNYLSVDSQTLKSTKTTQNFNKPTTNLNSGDMNINNHLHEHCV
jgi:hypothetical protein